MKKYKVKDLTKLLNTQRVSELNGEITLLKKWVKNGVEKCVVAGRSGYEYIVNADNLEEIKTKSNKKEKK